MTRRPHATAILNPQTGRRQAADLEAMLRATLERRFDLTILRSRYPGQARILAREAAQRSDVVIAVGGDGTVADVASGIVDSAAALAIIPTGSTNVIARGLGIPRYPLGAARILLRETELRYLDVADTGERATLHMAGCGFDALMMRDASGSLKRLAAWLAYLPPAVRHLASRSWNFRITVDDRELKLTAGMVLIANGSFVVNQWFQMGRDIRPDDGVLDVLIFAPPRPWSSLSIILWLLAGRVWRSRHYTHVSGKRVRVEAEPPAPVELDGDYVGWTPIELHIRPGALPVVVPAQVEVDRDECSDAFDAGRAVALDDQR